MRSVRTFREGGAAPPRPRPRMLRRSAGRGKAPFLHGPRRMSPTRVLVLGPGFGPASPFAASLGARGHEVVACRDLGSLPFLLERWIPRVVVLAPPVEARRHDLLKGVRRLLPQIPVVVLTNEAGPDLLLDLEAFPPTVPARRSRDLSDALKSVELAAEEDLAA